MAGFQVILLSISGSKFRRLGLPNRRFRRAGVAKNGFSQKSFIMDVGNDFDRFLKVLGASFLVFEPCKQAKK